MPEVISCGDFSAWFASLPEPDPDTVAVVIDLLEEHGVALGHPYSSDIKGTTFPLRELRPKTGRSPIRVFYAFDILRRAVLLTGADKSGVPKKRFYEMMIKKCTKFWDQHKNCK